MIILKPKYTFKLDPYISGSFRIYFFFSFSINLFCFFLIETITKCKRSNLFPALSSSSSPFYHKGENRNKKKKKNFSLSLSKLLPISMASSSLPISQSTAFHPRPRLIPPPLPSSSASAPVLSTESPPRCRKGGMLPRASRSWTR